MGNHYMRVEYVVAACATLASLASRGRVCAGTGLVRVIPPESMIAIVPASQVGTALRDRLANAELWVLARAFEPDDIAARLHHQLVLVHPWPNGNGRLAREMADALLRAEGRLPFSRGADDLGSTSGTRADYIAALKSADRGDVAPLLAFVRR